jgi:hypothetical protein
VELMVRNRRNGAMTQAKHGLRRFRPGLMRRLSNDDPHMLAQPSFAEAC